MDEGRGLCYKCKHLIKYYTKGVKRFNGTKYGWCCKRRGNVNIHDGCENYELKPKSKKKNRLFLRYYLNDLLTEISEIRKIAEVERSEREEDEKV